VKCTGCGRGLKRKQNQLAKALGATNNYCVKCTKEEKPFCQKCRSQPLTKEEKRLYKEVGVIGVWCGPCGRRLY